MLLVAHASSLDACTRQLQGRGHQSPQDFIQVVRKVGLRGYGLFLLPKAAGGEPRRSEEKPSPCSSLLPMERC